MAASPPLEAVERMVRRERLDEWQVRVAEIEMGKPHGPAIDDLASEQRESPWCRARF